MYAGIDLFNRLFSTALFFCGMVECFPSMKSFDIKSAVL